MVKDGIQTKLTEREKRLKDIEAFVLLFSGPQRGSRKLDKIAEKLKDRERPQKKKK